MGGGGSKGRESGKEKLEIWAGRRDPCCRSSSRTSRGDSTCFFVRHRGQAGVESAWLWMGKVAYEV